MDIVTKAYLSIKTKTNKNTSIYKLILFIQVREIAVVFLVMVFLTCPSPEQSNFPQHVDSEPCSPCYTWWSWDEKTQSIISCQDKGVSSRKPTDTKKTCFPFQYLLGACLCCWTTGRPDERAFFFNAFLAISLCFSVNNNNIRGMVNFSTPTRIWR